MGFRKIRFSSYEVTFNTSKVTFSLYLVYQMAANSYANKGWG